MGKPFLARTSSTPTRLQTCKICFFFLLFPARENLARRVAFRYRGCLRDRVVTVGGRRNWNAATRRTLSTLIGLAFNIWPIYHGQELAGVSAMERRASVNTQVRWASYLIGGSDDSAFNALGDGPMADSHVLILYRIPLATIK